MSHFFRSFKLFVFVVTAGLPVFAYAHAGEGTVHGFLHGMSHPFNGLDHVCAMIAVGLWAAQMGGRSTWLVPLTFVSIMAFGGLLGMAGIAVPFAESGIAASLLVLGVLIAAAARLALSTSAAIVGVFAVFHGYAHGVEMPHDVSGMQYAVGFVLATALLHVAGMTATLLARKYGRMQWLRFAGVAILLCGGTLVAV